MSLVEISIEFALDQLLFCRYRLHVFGYFRSVLTLGLRILIGFTSLDFNRYRFDSFGFELVSTLGFWILDRYRLWVFGFDRYRLWVFGFWISWLCVFRYFRSVLTLGFWILDRYRLWVFGFDRYRLWVFGFWISWLCVFGYFRSDFGFWIGIGFGSLDLISIGFEYLDFGSVSTSDPWFYTLNRLISFEYWMDSLLILVIVVNSNLH
ncbi:unnamed protein product [Rhizophagus irregularis]|nr:unnamed protein product [Rhizophagus irregularis]